MLDRRYADRTLGNQLSPASNASFGGSARNTSSNGPSRGSQSAHSKQTVVALSSKSDLNHATVSDNCHLAKTGSNIRTRRNIDGPALSESLRRGLSASTDF